jgi:hypothetical protein
MDYELRFSDEQAITADEISEDVVDLGAAQSPHANPQQNVGDGTMKLVIVIDEAFNTLTSMNISLESDSTADLATSATVHATRNLLLAEMTLNAGTYVIGSFDGPLSERYLGVRYDVVGSNPTTGKISAYLVRDAQENPRD